MGAGQSNSKLHCNRYLSGQGPPSLEQQASDGASSRVQAQSGCQPEGQMTWAVLYRDTPGLPSGNTLQINFVFPDGIQSEKHPHPGRPHSGLQLCAYLPDNAEGRKGFKLLQKAFDQQLLFTVAAGHDGADMVNTSVPIKIKAAAGNQVECYPDADELKTLRKLLKDHGME